MLLLRHIHSRAHCGAMCVDVCLFVCHHHRKDGQKEIKRKLRWMHFTMPFLLLWFPFWKLPGDDTNGTHTHTIAPQRVWSRERRIKEPKLYLNDENAFITSSSSWNNDGHVEGGYMWVSVCFCCGKHTLDTLERNTQKETNTHQRRKPPVQNISDKIHGQFSPCTNYRPMFPADEWFAFVCTVGRLHLWWRCLLSTVPIPDCAI